MGVLVDPVSHAPVSTSASGMLPGVLIPQWMTYPAGIIQERTGNELGCRGADLLGQLSELTLRAGPDVQPPAAARLAHAAPASSSR